MAGKGNKEIWKYAKGFDVNPQNRHTTGPNRKSFSVLNSSLLEKGIEPLSKKHLTDAYALIFNATEAELKELAEDSDVPVAYKIIIDELGNPKMRARAMADYRDYMFGKGVSTVEHKFVEQPLFVDISHRRSIAVLGDSRGTLELDCADADAEVIESVLGGEDRDLVGRDSRPDLDDVLSKGELSRIKRRKLRR